jgi:hypothetical protein
MCVALVASMATLIKTGELMKSIAKSVFLVAATCVFLSAELLAQPTDLAEAQKASTLYHSNEGLMANLSNMVGAGGESRLTAVRLLARFFEIGDILGNKAYDSLRVRLFGENRQQWHENNVNQKTVFQLMESGPDGVRLVFDSVNYMSRLYDNRSEAPNRGARQTGANGFKDLPRLMDSIRMYQSWSVSGNSGNTEKARRNVTAVVVDESKKAFSTVDEFMNGNGGSAAELLKYQEHSSAELEGAILTVFKKINSGSTDFKNPGIAMDSFLRWAGDLAKGSLFGKEKFRSAIKIETDRLVEGYTKTVGAGSKPLNLTSQFIDLYEKVANSRIEVIESYTKLMALMELQGSENVNNSVLSRLKNSMSNLDFKERFKGNSKNLVTPEEQRAVENFVLAFTKNEKIPREIRGALLEGVATNLKGRENSYASYNLSQNVVLECMNSAEAINTSKWSVPVIEIFDGESKRLAGGGLPIVANPCSIERAAWSY